jgi:hypothetical protein
MANQEHLDILKQGVQAWNQWKEEHSDIRLDLSEADLRGTILNGATLIEAILNETDLGEAILGWTIFGDIDLISA